MKKVKLPGDIARTMKTIGSKKVNVEVTDASDHVLTSFNTSRDEFDALMKCQVIKGEKTSGFFEMDWKNKKAKLKKELTLGSDKYIKVNKHVFKVFHQEKGWTYA